MTLDVHRVRQICSDVDRRLQSMKSDLGRIRNDFSALGPGFTGDRLYAREYSQFTAALTESERALEKVRNAARDISRKA